MMLQRLNARVLTKIRRLSDLRPLQQAKSADHLDYIQLNEALTQDKALGDSICDTIGVHYDFISQDEEKSLFEELEPYLKRMRYEFDHWDDAIHGYRETERLNWNEGNMKVLERVRKLAFPPGVGQLKQVHVLDLADKGYIKPHIDAVRFCGDTIAGLSLLTDSVMRLVHDKNKSLSADVLLKRRSLYIMRGAARYDYTHEILKNDNSFFRGSKVDKGRRISVICRNEPSAKDKTL